MTLGSCTWNSSILLKDWGVPTLDEDDAPTSVVPNPNNPSPKYRFWWGRP